MTFVCEACTGKEHDVRPIDCRGGTRCDCQHRLPHVPAPGGTR